MRDQLFRLHLPMGFLHRQKFMFQFGHGRLKLRTILSLECGDISRAEINEQR